MRSQAVLAAYEFLCLSQSIQREVKKFIPGQAYSKHRRCHRPCGYVSSVRDPIRHVVERRPCPHIERHGIHVLVAPGAAWRKG